MEVNNPVVLGKNKSMSSADLNHDGILDEEETKRYERFMEIDTKFTRDKTQIALAWVAMISMCVTTVLLFMPWVDLERISRLTDILDLFYVTQSGVIAFFIGAKTWLQSRRSEQSPMSKDH